MAIIEISLVTSDENLIYNCQYIPKASYFCMDESTFLSLYCIKNKAAYVFSIEPGGGQFNHWLSISYPTGSYTRFVEGRDHLSLPIDVILRTMALLSM